MRFAASQPTSPFHHMHKALDSSDPSSSAVQEALERAALVPAVLRAALAAMQPALAASESVLQPAHWREVTASLVAGARAPLLLDALFDATATVYAMACANKPCWGPRAAVPCAVRDAGIGCHTCHYKRTHAPPAALCGLPWKARGCCGPPLRDACAPSAATPAVKCADAQHPLYLHPLLPHACCQWDAKSEVANAHMRRTPCACCDGVVVAFTKRGMP